MNKEKFDRQDDGNSSDSEERARHQAYIAWSRKQWRKNYYRKHAAYEQEKARIRAKKRQITNNTPPDIAEERKKRHCEAQAQYYARKREAEIQRQAAYRLSLLTVVDCSDNADDADDEKDGLDTAVMGVQGHDTYHT